MDMDMDIDIDMTELRSTLLATIPENSEMQILRRSYRLGSWDCSPNPVLAE